MSHPRSYPDGDEPLWKKQGRHGALDWFLGCAYHGAELHQGCLSCKASSEHNSRFADELIREFGYEPRD